MKKPMSKKKKIEVLRFFQKQQESNIDIDTEVRFSDSSISIMFSYRVNGAVEIEYFVVMFDSDLSMKDYKNRLINIINLLKRKLRHDPTVTKL